MNTQRKITIGLAWFCGLAILSGCVAPSGKAKSERVIESYDAQGNLISRQIETDQSNMRSPALLATQSIRSFNHSRTNFLGSSSRTGFDKHEGDPDQEFAAVLGQMLMRSFMQGGLSQMAPISPVTPVQQPSPQPPPNAKEEKPSGGEEEP